MWVVEMGCMYVAVRYKWKDGEILKIQQRDQWYALAKEKARNTEKQIKPTSNCEYIFLLGQIKSANKWGWKKSRIFFSCYFRFRIYTFEYSSFNDMMAMSLCICACVCMCDESVRIPFFALRSCRDTESINMCIRML